MIVLTAVTGLRNRGVEALVETTVEGLRGVAPGEEVAVLTQSPDFDRDHGRRLGVTFAYDGFSMHARFPLLMAGAEAVRSAIGRQSETERSRRLVANAKLAIASGGDCFSSDYGSIASFLVPLRVARKAGVPFVFLAQSIGPFNDATTKKEFVSVARDASLVTVRESRSQAYAIDELGLDQERVALTADPAFLLEPPPAERVAQLRAFYGLSDDEPTVAIALSQGLCSFGGFVGERDGNQLADQHLASLAAVVEEALNRFDAQVLLIPHVQDAWHANDDRLLADRLAEHLGRDPRVKTAWCSHTASEFKGLIASCDLVVAERMHAGIAALSTATPVCVVRYSVKADGIIGDLIGEDAKETGAIIDYEDFLDPKHAVTGLRTAWSNRDAMRSKLLAGKPVAQDLARQNFTLLRDRDLLPASALAAAGEVRT
ncbi:MAG: polysaccharide pyruvyl transferase family protein [Planctomycetota bacterium]